MSIKCTCRCSRTAIHHAISCPVYVEFYERQFGRKPDAPSPQMETYNAVTAIELVKQLQAQLLTIRAIIANDTYASTFQNMDDYRKALGEL